MDADYSVVINLEQGDARLSLQSGQFDCPAGQRRAFVTNKHGAWRGCWTEDTEAFTIRWEDNDVLVIPKTQIEPAVPKDPMHRDASKNGA